MNTILSRKSLIPYQTTYFIDHFPEIKKYKIKFLDTNLSNLSQTAQVEKNHSTTRFEVYKYKN
jgi:hypothetical protein